MDSEGCERWINKSRQPPEFIQRWIETGQSITSTELRKALYSLNEAYVLHKRCHSTGSKSDLINGQNKGQTKSRYPPMAIERRHRRRANREYNRALFKQFGEQNLSDKHLKKSLRNSISLEKESIVSTGSVRSRLSSWISRLFSVRWRKSSLDAIVASPLNFAHDRTDQYIQHNSTKKRSYTDSRLVDSAYCASTPVKYHSQLIHQQRRDSMTSAKRDAWDLRPMEEILQETGENENFGISRKAKPSKESKDKNTMQEPSAELTEPEKEESRRKKRHKKHRKPQTSPNDEPLIVSNDLEQPDNHDVRQIPMVELHSFQAQPVDQVEIVQNTHINSVTTANAMNSTDGDPDNQKQKRGKKKSSKRPKHTDNETTESEEYVGESENPQARDHSRKHKSKKHRSKGRDKNDFEVKEDEGGQAGDDIHNEVRRTKHRNNQDLENRELRRRPVGEYDQEWDNLEPEDDSHSRERETRRVRDSTEYIDDKDDENHDRDNEDWGRKRHGRSRGKEKRGPSHKSGRQDEESRSKHRGHKSRDRYDASDSGNGRSYSRMQSKYSSDPEEGADRERFDTHRHGRRRHHHRHHRRRNHRDSRCDFAEEYRRRGPDCSYTGHKCKSTSVPPRCCSEEMDDGACSCYRRHCSRQTPCSSTAPCCNCTCSRSPRAYRPDGELIDALSEVCSELSSRLGDGRFYPTRDIRAIRQLRTPKLGRYLSPETLNLLEILDPSTNCDRLSRRFVDYGLPPRAPRRRASDPESDRLTCPCSVTARSLASQQQKQQSSPPALPPPPPPPPPQPPVTASPAPQPTPTPTIQPQITPQSVQPTTQIITPVLYPVSQPTVQAVAVPTTLPTASWYPTPVPAAPPTNMMLRPNQLLLPPPSLPAPQLQPQPLASHSTMGSMGSVYSPYVMAPTVYQPSMLMPHLTHYHR